MALWGAVTGVKCLSTFPIGVQATMLTVSWGVGLQNISFVVIPRGISVVSIHLTSRCASCVSPCISPSKNVSSCIWSCPSCSWGLSCECLVCVCLAISSGVAVCVVHRGFNHYTGSSFGGSTGNYVRLCGNWRYFISWYRFPLRAVMILMPCFPASITGGRLAFIGQYSVISYIHVRRWTFSYAHVYYSYPIWHPISIHFYPLFFCYGPHLVILSQS
jgi:hypothetical protein